MLEPEIRLRQAIIDGNLLVVKRLLNRFPDLLENIDSSNGWTSLHYAAYYGRYLICVHLISLGHDKNETWKTFKNDTCVHLSLMNGHEQTTHFLLQHFKKLLNMKGDLGYTPLHVSTVKDYFKCIEMLLHLGADINAVDDEGNNCLHLAMKFNSLQTMKLLIKGHIDINLKNKHGLKPVDVASTFQTETYYNSILKDPISSSEDHEVLVTPTLNSQSTFDGSPLQSLFPQQRTHSASLPPLPSVTTTRRPSTSSVITSSPVPRSAISLEFNGSNSNSYIYSPVQSMGKQPKFAGLNVKPPTLGITKSSSPVLYSPTNPTIFSRRDDQTQTNGGFSNRDFKPNTNNTGGTLSSYSSMSSLNSAFERKSVSESRTRANSALNGTSQVSFVSINKTRSNSSESKKNFNVSTPDIQEHQPQLSKLPQRKPPGKASPPNTSTFSLSRSSTNASLATVSTTSEGEYVHTNPSSTSLNGNPRQNTGLFGYDDNESLKSKISAKFESVAKSYRKRTTSFSSNHSSGNNSEHSSTKNSILNINISSLGRRKDH